ncbi:putative transcription factor interactor and regulator CCHC(Zn) family [Helianthus anomalus]
MVEIGKSEISKFAGKGHKMSYNKPGYKKKNMKAGLGYKRKQTWKQTEKTNVQQKMNFVQGKSLKEEEQLKFGQQSNKEFDAKKKKQQHAKDVSKKVCFKCDQVGHVARKCQNSKRVDVEKQKSESEKKNQLRLKTNLELQHKQVCFESNLETKTD